VNISMARAMGDNRIRRLRKHRRVRRKVNGTADRPRLSVYASLNHIYAQIIDDTAQRTLASASTVDKEFGGVEGHLGNQNAAKHVGEMVAKRALALGISKVVFDRGGYLYHGRIKVLADAARSAGLDF